MHSYDNGLFISRASGEEEEEEEEEEHSDTLEIKPPQVPVHSRKKEKHKRKHKEERRKEKLERRVEKARARERDVREVRDRGYERPERQERPRPSKNILPIL